MVPSLEQYKEYLQSFESLLSGVTFIRHRLKVQNIIKEIETKIKNEKRRNFMEDY